MLGLTGAGTAAAAVGFILASDDGGAGLLERAALWPVLFALAVSGAVLARRGAHVSRGNRPRRGRVTPA